MTFEPVPFGMLSGEEAIAAALAALPRGTSPVLVATFTYNQPCQPDEPCASALRPDAGFVVIASATGGVELVSVVKAANGTITATGPIPYAPSSRPRQRSRSRASFPAGVAPLVAGGGVASGPRVSTMAAADGRPVVKEAR